MKNILLIGVILVILVGGFVYIRRNNPASPSNTTVDQSEPTSSPKAEPFISSSPDTSTLKAGGNSYLDTKGVYSFLYPNDYQINQESPDHTRIYKQGATQAGQTEMYDGVIVVFESVNLGGKTLSDWVDTRIKESTTDGTIEVSKPKQATRLNTYPGFTYEVRGLGSSTYLVLQKNAQSDYGVVITYLVSDPENVGFQTEVDTILSTVELLK